MLDEQEHHAYIAFGQSTVQLIDATADHLRCTEVLVPDVSDAIAVRSPNPFSKPPVPRIIEDQHLVQAATHQPFDICQDLIDLGCGEDTRICFFKSNSAARAFRQMTD